MSARRRAGPRALLLLSGLFLLSAVLRVADRDGAIAKEVQARTEAQPPAPAPGPATAEGCVPDPGTEALLAAIREREAQLEARARAIAEREQVLTVAKLKVEEQISALTDAEKRLAETLALADKAAEADVARLVAVYENMAPKAAAQIFAGMDVVFAAGLIGRMKAETAAAVLAGLPTDRAYAISATLAGRNARAPTE